MRLEELNKEFIAKEFQRKDIIFYDIKKTPFRVYGLYQPKTQTIYRRMPQKIADSVSPVVSKRATNTAGGRVRFKTDSPFIAICADMPPISVGDSTPMMGRSFSVYINYESGSTFFGTFRYKVDELLEGKGMNSIITMSKSDEKMMRDLTIYFPSYADINNVYIGVQEDSQLLPGGTYRRETPVVFYGSSITQGACASRAGNSYADMLSRKFDFDYVNLGFASGAKGEDIMADYLASQDMSVFIYDYDHNSPNLEHLQNTHEKLFRKVRSAHPCIPIIIMSAPNFDADRALFTKRRNCIFSTYAHAYEEGDRNVYFVDGERMFGAEGRDACTVDGCHPNDLGMYRMAEALCATMKAIWEKEEHS